VLISIKPTLQPPTTDFWIGKGLLEEDLVPTLIKKWGHSAVIIADPTVAKLYGEKNGLKMNF
jgi:hypothetical protein